MPAADSIPAQLEQACDQVQAGRRAADAVGLAVQANAGRRSRINQSGQRCTQSGRRTRAGRDPARHRLQDRLGRSPGTRRPGHRDDQAESGDRARGCERSGRLRRSRSDARSTRRHPGRGRSTTRALDVADGTVGGVLATGVAATTAAALRLAQGPADRNHDRPGPTARSPAGRAARWSRTWLGLRPRQAVRRVARHARPDHRGDVPAASDPAIDRLRHDPVRRTAHLRATGRGGHGAAGPLQACRRTQLAASQRADRARRRARRAIRSKRYPASDLAARTPGQAGQSSPGQIAPHRSSR